MPRARSALGFGLAEALCRFIAIFAQVLLKLVVVRMQQQLDACASAGGQTHTPARTMRH